MKTASHLLCLGLIFGKAFGASFQEDFSTDPGAQGWGTFGNSALFQWDPAAQDLAVTWDSSQVNSYFYHSLGTIVTKTDDCQVSFDLRLQDIAVGVDPAKTLTFELAVGFLNLSEATSRFTRGTASQSPDLVEFDYFPDSGFGATVSPVLVSSTGQFVPSFSFPLELTVGDLFHVEMKYTATNQTLSTAMLRNGQPFGPIKDTKPGSTFTDFRVDTVAVSSYSDTGADGSLLAHGIVDNISVMVPDPPLTALRGSLRQGTWQVQFTGRTGWNYALERSLDWQTWTIVGAVVAGNGQPQSLQDPLAGAAPYAFYRVRADRP